MSRFEALHRVVGPRAETQRHDDDVGRVESFGAGERFTVVGIDRAVGVEGEEHGGFEAVALTKNFRQHRQRFFATIFFVAGEQHDVFALGGHAGRRLEHESCGGGGERRKGGRGEKQAEAKEIHKERKD